MLFTGTVTFTLPAFSNTSVRSKASPGFSSRVAPMSMMCSPPGCSTVLPCAGTSMYGIWRMRMIILPSCFSMMWVWSWMSFATSPSAAMSLSGASPSFFRVMKAAATLPEPMGGRA